jgi:organic radical activating enzyme
LNHSNKTLSSSHVKRFIIEGKKIKPSIWPFDLRGDIPYYEKMSKTNIPIKTLQFVRSELNTKSPSLCLAKWLQVTVHLQNGQTHSCHHPTTHKIPLHEIKSDSSALHNTTKKKLARKEMLEGIRPTECEYCWKIEDTHPDNLSDRTLKSAQDWSYPRINEIKNAEWSDSTTPSYVEVSFGSECNLRCAYCAPHISSSIMKEVKEFGPYSAQQGFSIQELDESGLLPLPKDQNNPYVDAFWDWWPKLHKDLKVFRITGGEPLLNANTFKFLSYVRNNPMPNLTLAINSNLSIPKVTFDKFLSEVKYLTENKLIKEFQLFTSVDTHGPHAEFIRYGLDYNELMRNVRTFLDEVKESELIFMSTYNAFSVINYHKFLEEVTSLKSTYFDSEGSTRVTLDLPYLKDPIFLSCYVLTADFLPKIRADIKYLEVNAKDKSGREIYYPSEISKFERILSWLENLDENEHRNNSRRELSVFLKEYAQRKKIEVNTYLPEYASFIKICDSLI